MNQNITSLAPQTYLNKVKSLLSQVDIKPVFSGLAFIFSVIVVSLPLKVTPTISNHYTIYSSKPPIYTTEEKTIYFDDSRSQRINLVFKEFKCPLEGLGEVFVREADKNNIPWWIVASISFQESSCGKNTPKLDGNETYNGWGWAVYGENVHQFDNWAQGIEVVSKYLSKTFFSKGITETCDIMKTYTPPSQGSWCKGVNYFGNYIQNYTSE